MKTDMDHPSEAMLVLALDNELDRHEAAAIREHLDACATCRKAFEEFRRLSEQIVDYHQSIRPRRSAQRHFLPYFAAAAALLVATSGWYWTRSNRPAPQQHQVVAVEAPTMVNMPATPVVQHARHRRHYTRTVAARTPSFLALPFSDSALPLTEATIVRARIPIEELRLTGLTVEPAPKGASVEADVLLGIDGLPRAIRFVQ